VPYLMQTLADDTIQVSRPDGSHLALVTGVSSHMLLTELNQLQDRLEALGDYSQHKPWCDTLTVDGASLVSCTCGLARVRGF
jgi:hypothetical protein